MKLIYKIERLKGGEYEKNNLLFDNGYKYGSAWLFRPIPKKDLQEIKRIIEEV